MNTFKVHPDYFIYFSDSTDFNANPLRLVVSTFVAGV